MAFLLQKRIKAARHITVGEYLYKASLESWMNHLPYMTSWIYKITLRFSFSEKDLFINFPDLLNMVVNNRKWGNVWRWEAFKLDTLKRTILPYHEVRFSLSGLNGWQKYQILNGKYRIT